MASSAGRKRQDPISRVSGGNHRSSWSCGWGEWRRTRLSLVGCRNVELHSGWNCCSTMPILSWALKCFFRVCVCDSESLFRWFLEWGNLILSYDLTPEDRCAPWLGFYSLYSFRVCIGRGGEGGRCCSLFYTRSDFRSVHFFIFHFYHTSSTIFWPIKL